MPRQAQYRVPVDTFYFSPHQVHPKAALRLAFGSVAQSVREQIMRWSKLIEKHQWSFVLVGFDLRYEKPLVFEGSGDWLDVQGGLVLRGGGSLMEHRCVIGCNDVGAMAQAISITTLWRPVKLSGSDELAGVPQPADAWLSSQFTEDERDSSKPGRVMPAELEALERDYKPVVEHHQRMVVTRDECELADQWQFISLAGYVARSREALAMASSERGAKQGLSRPVARVLAELTGPLYFASNITVGTQCLQRGDAVAFRHRVADATFGARELPSATVIEWFA